MLKFRNSSGGLCCILEANSVNPLFILTLLQRFRLLRQAPLCRPTPYESKSSGSYWPYDICEVWTGKNLYRVSINVAWRTFVIFACSVKNRSIGSTFGRDAKRRKSEGSVGKAKIDSVDRSVEVKGTLIDVAILLDTDTKFPAVSALNELFSLGRLIRKVECNAESGILLHINWMLMYVKSTSQCFALLGRFRFILTFKFVGKVPIWDW